MRDICSLVTNNAVFIQGIVSQTDSQEAWEKVKVNQMSKELKWVMALIRKQPFEKRVMGSCLLFLQVAAMRREQLEATGALPEELGELTEEQTTGRSKLTGATGPHVKNDLDEELTGAVGERDSQSDLQLTGFLPKRRQTVNIKDTWWVVRDASGKYKPVYGYARGQGIKGFSTCPNPFSQMCEICGERKYRGKGHITARTSGHTALEGKNQLFPKASKQGARSFLVELTLLSGQPSPFETIRAVRTNRLILSRVKLIVA